MPTINHNHNVSEILYDISTRLGEVQGTLSAMQITAKEERQAFRELEKRVSKNSLRLVWVVATGGLSGAATSALASVTGLLNHLH